MCALLAAAGAALGCQSTQSRNDELEREAKRIAQENERGLVIRKVSRDISVVSTAVLTDRRSQRTAAVVTLRNTSPRPYAKVPIAITVTGRGGRKLFANDLPGAADDLTHAALVDRELVWVNDQIAGIRGARAVRARVGASPVAAGPLPQIDVHAQKLSYDDIERASITTGRVVNRSKVTQRRLVVFGVARRGARVVAAGRAIVPRLNPGGKGTRFTLFWIGNPRGAKLSFSAPAANTR